MLKILFIKFSTFVLCMTISSVLLAHGRPHNFHPEKNSSLISAGFLDISQEVQVSYPRQDLRLAAGEFDCGDVSDLQARDSYDILNLDVRQKRIRFPGNVNQIILCQGIQADHHSLGGAAIPEKNTILIDIRVSDQNLTHLFWHEVWHHLERTISRDFVNIWDAEYGGYLNIYKESSSQSIILGSGDRGFINRYGQSFAAEERAEIFAWFLNDKKSLTTYLKKSRDSILAGKIYQMKKTLESLELR